MSRDERKDQTYNTNPVDYYKPQRKMTQNVAQNKIILYMREKKYKKCIRKYTSNIIFQYI